MAIWTLAKKELRLFLRDRLSALLLLGMPLVFILLLGLLLGEGFGQKPDERLRISVVDLDEGRTQARNNLNAYMTVLLQDQPFAAAGCSTYFLTAPLKGVQAFPVEPWSDVVLRDLSQTAGIRVEIIPSREEAERLCRDGKRAAVLVFREDFSERVGHCSFLVDGVNPFFREGVRLQEVGAELLTDQTQLAASSIIEQVAQVSLMRVILPYMIGRAFEKLGEPAFMTMLVQKVPGGALLPRTIKDQLGAGVQGALKDLFPRYNLTGKTWAALTKSVVEPAPDGGVHARVYVNDEGTGFLNRGAARYQVLVPAYTVMFAFSLVLSVGWLFVTERRQGTLKRLKAAPLRRTEVLLGKLLPCYLLSLSQGIFLLAAGKLLFGMRWGPDHWSFPEQAAALLPVVATTSLAAMGMAMFIAAIARSEMQVALYGTLIVLVLALISGCLIPREMMPERTQELGLLTPHGWALRAYRQLLINPEPAMGQVWESCGVLGAFGVSFLGLAWGSLRLD